MTDQAEPDDKVRPGTDASCICNLPHGICSVARVDKKGRSASLWMILQDMSSLHTKSKRVPTPTLIPPITPTLFNPFLYCGGTRYW